MAPSAASPPSLLHHFADLDDPRSGHDYRYYRTADEGHGRKEVRPYHLLTAPAALADAHADFAGLRSLGMVFSERRVGDGPVAIETRFSISRLSWTSTQRTATSPAPDRPIPVADAGHISHVPPTAAVPADQGQARLVQRHAFPAGWAAWPPSSGAGALAACPRPPAASRTDGHRGRSD
jgi:hypothetical protein